MISTIRTPQLVRDLLEILQLVSPETPQESLIIDINYSLAQICTFYRLRAGGTFGNYYGMIFMPSGVGKDFPLDYLDQNVLTPFIKEFDRKSIEYKRKRDEEVWAEAEERYQTKAQRESYYHLRQAREFSLKTGVATKEGFDDARLEYMIAGFGGTNVILREFADYLSSMNGANGKGELLSQLTEVYESGNSEAKVIKTNKFAKTITGVPSNALLHTSPARIETSQNKLLDFFDRGAARRYFVCYPEMPEVNLTAKELVANRRKALELCAVAREKIGEIMYWAENAGEMTLDPFAEETLAHYELGKKAEARAMSQNGYSIALTSLHRKALKLAIIYAMADRNPVVDFDHVSSAVYQCNLYQQHFAKFYESADLRGADKAMMLYNMLLASPLTTMDIRNSKILGWRNFPRALESIIPDVELIAEANGRTLLKERLEKSTRYILTESLNNYDSD